MGDFDVAGVTSICVSVPVALWLRSISTNSGIPWLASAHGLGLSFVWVAILLPPILWSLGLATPWDDVNWQQISSIHWTAILLACALTAGANVGIKMAHELPSRPVLRAAGINSFGLALLISATGGLVSVIGLHLAAGGLGTLLENQVERRDLLQGAGVLLVLAVLGGFGPVVALLGKLSRPHQWVLAGFGGLGFLTYSFFTGSRFALVAYALALCIAFMRMRRPRLWPFLLVVGATVPFSVWYAQRVRHGLVGPVFSGDGVRDVLASVIDPFTFGGLDILRTLGATLNHEVSTVSFDLGPLVAGIGTIVPRVVWPSKPVGYSLEFSETYFPLRWSQGTGVPPSFLAESILHFGFLGGSLMLFATGYLVARISRAYWRGASATILVLGPLLMTDFLILFKSGSDSFLRLLVAQVIATAIIVFVMKVKVRSV